MKCVKNIFLNFDFLKKHWKLQNGHKCVENIFLNLWFFREDINKGKNSRKIIKWVCEWPKCIENIFFGFLKNI